VKLRFERTDLGIVLFLLIVGVFQVATVQRIESFGSDSSFYIMLAQNIRHAGQYEFNRGPHTIYPPGFPLLLACIAAFTGREGYDIFVRFMPVFSTLALIVWYFVLRRDNGRGVAGGCCLLVATSAPLYQLVTRSVLSDAPFFLVSGLALLCVMGLEEYGEYPRPVLYGLVTFSCLATILTVLLRSVGVALSAALAAWAITGIRFRESRRSAAWRTSVLASILGLAVFVWWVGWTKHAERKAYPGEQMGTYASQFTAVDPHRPELGTASARAFVFRLATNIPIQASHIAALAIRAPYVMPTWYSPLAVMVLALLACGLASYAWGNQETLLACYFLAYFSVYLFWPFDEGPRFMLPVAPLAFALIWRGARISAHLLRTRPGITLGTISGLAVCFAVVTDTADRLPGFQARSAVVLWPLAATLSGLLMLLVKRAGTAKAKVAIDSLVANLHLHRVECGIAGLATLVAVGAFQIAGNARTNLAPNASSFRHHASADFSSWLNGAKDGPVMAQQYAIVHRLTGRKVVDFPVTSDPKVIATVLAREMVRYVVVNDEVNDAYYFPTEEERLGRIEIAYPSLLHLVYRGPGYRVFELDPGD
jgi:hypothetical protein